MSIRYCRCVLFGILLFVTGCGGPKLVSQDNIQEYKHVVATISGGYELTFPEVYEWLNDSRYVVHGGTVPVAQVRSFIDSMLLDTLAGMKAATFDLKKHRDAYWQYIDRIRTRLIGAYFEIMIKPRIEIDSLALEEFYYSREDLFGFKAQVKLHHLLLSADGLKVADDSILYLSMTDEERDSVAHGLVMEAYQQLLDGKPFDETARQYSHDAAVETNSGFIGWSARGRYSDPTDSIAFSLDPGGISAPFRDQTGWHILHSEGKLDGGIPILVDSLRLSAYNTMYSELANEQSLAILDSLVLMYPLTYNDSVMNGDVINLPRWTWAAAVSDVDSIYVYELQQLEPAVRERYGVANTTPEMKKEMMEQLANRHIVTLAAFELRVDTIPDIAELDASLRHKYARAEIIKEGVDLTWRPADSMISAYYDARREEYKVTKPLTVQQIIIKDSVFGEFLRDQAMSGLDFLELARKHYPGDESMREQLADLGDIGPDDISPEFYRAAQFTATGEISHPVRTRFGFHLIKVVGRKGEKTLSHVRSEIIAILRTMHRHELLTEYRERLYSEFNVNVSGKIYPLHIKPLDYRR